MADSFLVSTETLSLLYGDAFYIVGDANTLEKDRKLESGNVLKVAPTLAPPTRVAQQQGNHDLQGKQSQLSEEQQSADNQMSAQGIMWKPKDTSSILFILHQAELKDQSLTDLLKKIVASIGIRVESAGFGIITGPVQSSEFEKMPTNYAVVFDSELWSESNVIVPFGENEIFFSVRLKELQKDPEAKRLLWAYLKQLKEKLN